MTVQQTIPASQIVAVNPNVLGAGGSAVDLNGLYLTTSWRVPVGTVLSFPSAAAVAAFFGGSSVEARKAAVYFQGYDGSFLKPAAILFTQYPQADVAAYLESGNLSGLSLTALKAITGTLTITMDGFAHTASALNLSAATTFSSAAGIIQTAINGSLATLASATTGSISGNVFTAAGALSGTFGPGQLLTGAGITANTYISGPQLTGTPGGAGTYPVNNSQTIGAEAITATAVPVVVTYDSVSSAFIFTSGVLGTSSSAAYATGTTAVALELTLATGAVLSQGAAAAAPGAFMTAIAAAIQNWATFSTTFDPDGGSGNTNKVAFALWTSQQNNRFAYIAWDTDASPTVSVPASSSLGQILAANNYSGTCPIYEPSDLDVEAFVMGAAASIDFDQTNGRATMAFRSQAGLAVGVTSGTIAQNLLGNGYNYYGSYATANANFVFLYDGSISGNFNWLDSYLNQIWLNANFQLDGMELLTSVGSIPYNAAGYGLIEAAFADTINAALNFGAMRAGVTLSAAQIAEVNNAAGSNIAPTLSTRGWYLQILDAPPAVRALRGPPPANFWYMDGESVAKISLNSVDVL